jgi:hypothetical protein
MNLVHNVVQILEKMPGVPASCTVKHEDRRTGEQRAQCQESDDGTMMMTREMEIQEDQALNSTIVSRLGKGCH